MSVKNSLCDTTILPFSAAPFRMDGACVPCIPPLPMFLYAPYPDTALIADLAAVDASFPAYRLMPLIPPLW